MFNFLVYTLSPFNFNCGGLVVQYEFCRIIDSLGFKIKIYAPEKIPNSIFSNYYEDDYDLNETFVIYGETIEGNPLNAPHVVRWILAPLGIACESKLTTWNEGDLVYYFNPNTYFFNNPDKVGGIYKLLTVIYLNPIIKNYNLSGRIGYCHTLRKSHYHKILKLSHPPKTSTEITREHKMLEVINIFNKKKIFISYDPLTFLNVMAALCGCISVVVKVDGLSEPEWLQTTAVYPYLKDNNLNKLYGIAYGLSEIDWAKNTIHLVKEQWSNILVYTTEKSILPFIDDIRKLSNGENLENTVKNNFS
jgi:hypothetical protein